MIRPSGETNEPGAAVVEPDRREPEVVDPPRGRLEAVLLLELLERQVVEDPHALVGDVSTGAKTITTRAPSRKRDCHEEFLC